jgi:16S rRNA pseudouridine516 synthase
MPSAKKTPRLDQLLSSLGYCSRREVTYLIKDERITVKNEEKITANMRVNPLDVLLDGEELDNPLGLLILMNKPTGYVCSHNVTEGASVFDLLPERWNNRSPAIQTVGRLDKDTSGLLLLTDQHDLIHILTSPKNHVTKTYIAEVESNLNESAIEKFASGTLILEDEKKPCLPAKLEIISPRKACISLNEGRFHQVRRMFAHVGCPVISLHREKFAELSLEGIELGEFKLLNPEINSVITGAK